MYENESFQRILERMLEASDSSLDKRESSTLYNMQAPVAFELGTAYYALDWILRETFAATASREHLILRAAERGLSPEPATKAIFRATFNMDIPIGSRFSLDNVNFKAVKRLSQGEYQMECETLGSASNQFSGSLIPIEYIYGLETATLSELLIPGEDEEDTERFRQRYFDSLKGQAFGGNVRDYQEKVNAISGVGGVKVYPIWAGGGTVKLTIINSDFKQPSRALVEAVQEAIDPVGHSGKGAGIAPIGHVVTVTGVSEMPINLDFALTYEPGWAWADVQTYVAGIVDGYFQELAKSWEGADTLIVRISQLESRILELSGIVDVTATKINGVAGNCTLPADTIPVRGELSG